MKKITFLMFAALVVLAAKTNAQTEIYTEDFESYTIGELPTGWSEELGDPGLVWTVEGVKNVHDEDNGDWESTAHGGEKSLFNVENWGADGPTDVIGITPELDFTNFNQVSMTLFELRGWDNYWPADKAEHAAHILAMEEGTTDWILIDSVMAKQENFQNWTEVNVDLSAVAGKRVKIGFKINTHTYYWRIDDITINGLTTGVEGLENKMEVSAYPNPVKDVLNISLNQNVQNAEVAIFDITGKTVYTMSNLNDSETSVNISVLPSGIYFLSINANGLVSTQKIVKQ